MPLEDMEIIYAISASLMIIEGPGKIYCGKRLHGFLPWPVVVFARSLDFSSGAPILINREGDSTHCPQGGAGYLPVSMGLSSGFGAGI